MADTEELEGYLATGRRLAILAVLGFACMLIVAAIDYKLKRDIVREADRWREEIRNVPAAQRPEHWRQPREQRSPRPAVPDPAPSPGPGPGMANGAAPQAEEDIRPPIPIVQPGNDAFRPPHRGAIDG